jgi:hypothetical protein
VTQREIEGGDFAVQIAAILTVPADEGDGRGSQDDIRPYSAFDLLGANLVDRTKAKLKHVGTLQPTVLTDGNVFSQVLPSHSARSSVFMDDWENAVSGYINGGADVLVLVRVGAYEDVDYAEVLKFHMGTQSPLTQVYGADGSLNIAVVDATLLRDCDDLVRRVLSHLIPQQRRFHYSGYVNRLRRPQDLHRLIGDGLEGRCGLRPAGEEILPSVWVGVGAEVHPTVKIKGSVFVGTGSRVSEGCTIAGPSSIERDCHIDCATLIDGALVLQGTYVGVALDVRRAIVGDEKLFNLERNVEVTISDARLVGRSARPVGFLAGLTSLLRSQAPAGD